MQIPGFDTQHSINQDQWSIPVIQTLRKQRENSQCYLWLDDEFKSSLGYITGFLLKRKKNIWRGNGEIEENHLFPTRPTSQNFSFWWMALTPSLFSNWNLRLLSCLSRHLTSTLSGNTVSFTNKTDSNYVHRSHFSLPVDPHTKTKTSDSCNCFLSAFLDISLVLEDPFSNNGTNV